MKTKKSDPVLATSEPSVRASLLGERIEVKQLPFDVTLSKNPYTIACSAGGVAVVFRFGAVVFIGVSMEDEYTILKQLESHTQNPYSVPQCEELKIRITPERTKDDIENGIIHLVSGTLERLQLVADVLARSVLLERYESLINADFDFVETLASAFREGFASGRKIRSLMAAVGNSLLREHRMVGRASVIDKPEVLWDFSELERLYLQLENEFEITERYNVLQRKLELVSRTAQTLLDWMQNRRSYRVEQYIVLLIVFEVILSLYDKFLS